MDFKLVIAPTMSLVVPSMIVTSFNEKLASFAESAARVMYSSKGIGLAAPQVGYNVAMMILSLDIANTNPTIFKENRVVLPDGLEFFAIVNPKIIAKSDQMVDLIKGEGCLSFPLNETGKVDRHKSIEFTYQNLDGEEFTNTIDGIFATIVHHEADHLWGVLFPARMKPIDRQKIIAKYCAYNQVNYDLIDRFVDVMMFNATSERLFENSNELIDFRNKHSKPHVDYYSTK